MAQVKWTSPGPGNHGRPVTPETEEAKLGGKKATFTVRAGQGQPASPPAMGIRMGKLSRSRWFLAEGAFSTTSSLSRRPFLHTGASPAHLGLRQRRVWSLEHDGGSDLMTGPANDKLVSAYC